MLTAILQIILACFLWGGLFAVPVYLEEFHPVDIVLGRFFFYGILSLLFFMFYVICKKDLSFIKYIKAAVLCAFIMNIVHYTALTLGIRYANPSFITLILGVSPIAITVASCWVRRETHLLPVLLWPSVCIFLGIFFMNLDIIGQRMDGLSPWDYANGIFYGLLALGTWTWYVVYNAEFLQKHPDINAGQWTVLLGMATLGFTTIAIIVRYYMVGSSHFYQFHWEHETGRFFLLSMMILGVFCSWVAFALWNASSMKISPALGGQLSILETVFGLALVYCIQWQLPTFYETLGIVFILSGVSLGLYRFMRATEGVAQETN